MTRHLDLTQQSHYTIPQSLVEQVACLWLAPSLATLGGRSIAPQVEIAGLFRSVEFHHRVRQCFHNCCQIGLSALRISPIGAVAVAIDGLP